MIERLKELVNKNDRLVQKGNRIDEVVLVGVGSETYRVTIRRGAIDSVEKGPFVMPSYTFGIFAPKEEWELFWSPTPPPGSHDLFALLKRRKLRLEGDLHCFMANLFYFKEVFASLRAREV